MMKRFAVAAALVLCASARLSAQVIDQSNPSIVGAYGGLDLWSSQTFRPSASTVAGAGFGVQRFSSLTTGALTIEFWSDVASNPGATLLASGTTVFDLGQSSTGMVDVFWTAISVTPGSQYYLATRMTADGGSFATTFGTSSYLDGQSGYNYSTDVTAPNTFGAGYDLTFREYSVSGAEVTTPEPASLVLVATGLLGIAGTVRRRRTRRV